MKNQAKRKAASDENELGNTINISAWAMQNERFNYLGEDTFPLEIKLGKTEEEILFDLVGKLSIPMNSLNAIPFLFKQS